MRFFIVGANGHLGSRLCPFLESKGHIVFKLSRNEKEIKHLFSKINPQVIINLAANTNVDECEQNIRSAFHSNIEPLNMLSKYINTNIVCKDGNIKIFQFIDSLLLLIPSFPNAAPNESDKSSIL